MWCPAGETEHCEWAEESWGSELSDLGRSPATHFCATAEEAWGAAKAPPAFPFHSTISLPLLWPHRLLAGQDQRAHGGCRFISSTHTGGRVRTGVVSLHYHVIYSLNTQHWKKSYDKPRQHIKKQRHRFTNKDPSSQSHGFSSSHGRMWELDQKEGWALKNWCF